MSLKKLEADLEIISKLGTNPGVDDGLSEEKLKAKFDEAASIIKDYINNVLVPEFEKTVDVDALLKDILDVTLSKSDKAANAKATGDQFRSMRTFFEKVIHGGDYVLESDGNLEAGVVGDVTVRIQGGQGVIQGNLFAINLNKYEDVTLEPGTYGLSRNDLIVVRCSKNDAGDLSYKLVALTGTNTSGNPVDPEYITGDINGDNNTHDFPLYRVKFNGVDITAVEPLFIPEKPLYQYIKDYVKEYADTKTVSAILSASAWSDTSPYTQAVVVNGLTDQKKAISYPDVPDDPETEALLAEESAKVTSCKRSGNVMTFRCRDDKPAMDIPIIVEVYV